MKQPELLEMINGTIKRALNTMLQRGLIKDQSFAERIATNVNVPYRHLQALILTSDAFLAMSIPDAANVMGISTHAIDKYLWELRKEYPHLELFEQVWKPQSVENIDSTDETAIKQVF